MVGLGAKSYLLRTCEGPRGSRPRLNSAFVQPAAAGVGRRQWLGQVPSRVVDFGQSGRNGRLGNQAAITIQYHTVTMVCDRELGHSDQARIGPLSAASRVHETSLSFTCVSPLKSTQYQSHSPETLQHAQCTSRSRHQQSHPEAPVQGTFILPAKAESGRRTSCDKPC